MWETAHVLDALITGIHGQVTLLLLPWKPPGTRTRVPYCTIPIELSPENFLRLFFLENIDFTHREEEADAETSCGSTYLCIQ